MARTLVPQKGRPSHRAIERRLAEILDGRHPRPSAEELIWIERWFWQGAVWQWRRMVDAGWQPPAGPRGAATKEGGKS